MSAACASRIRRQIWTWPGWATAIAALALSAYWFWHPWRNPRLMNHSAPEKSIAVLPFENLSTEKENAFFADGVQDQILTDLAKVADLKVIGHTSVEQYKSDEVRATGKRSASNSASLTFSRVRFNARPAPAHHRASIDARTNESALGRNLRSRTGGCLWHPERNRADDCGAIARDHFTAGKGSHREPPTQTSPPTTFSSRRRN